MLNRVRFYIGLIRIGIALLSPGTLRRPSAGFKPSLSLGLGKSLALASPRPPASRRPPPPPSLRSGGGPGLCVRLSAFACPARGRLCFLPSLPAVCGPAKFSHFRQPAERRLLKRKTAQNLEVGKANLPCLCFFEFIVHFIVVKLWAVYCPQLVHDFFLPKAKPCFLARQKFLNKPKRLCLFV